MNGRSLARRQTLQENTAQEPSPHQVIAKPRYLCQYSMVAVAETDKANTISPQVDVVGIAPHPVRG